jgi:hypothetical protein
MPEFKSQLLKIGERLVIVTRCVIDYSVLQQRIGVQHAQHLPGMILLVLGDVNVAA